MSKGKSVRVLIACDKFKGSLDAVGVTEAIARGLPSSWERVACPIADGGEGFVDAMLAGSPGRRVEVEALDALGRPCTATYGMTGTTALVEMSAASGLWRIAPEERDPRKSSTFGTGQLIRHAVEVSGAERVFVGLGGSATNDGGAGMAAALGVRFYDANGQELASFPEALAELSRLDESGRIELPEIVVACDVDHPLCGERGASAVFGPQKGADAGDVAFLDRVLSRMAEVAGGGDLANTAGAGAGGGLGFGLMRFAGAGLVSGFDLVAQAVDLEKKIAAADLVITGEGSLDEQTLGGKGPAGVAAMARRAGVPVIAVAGRVDERARPLFEAAFSLESFGLPKAESMARAAELIEETIRRNSDGIESILNRSR